MKILTCRAQVFVLAGLLAQLGFSAEPESNWEIWQWENFYGLSGDIFSDEDSDGISDFIEFGFGLNPLEKQAGDEYSADLTITQNPDKEIELSLWQPELQDEFLGGEGFYGRQWFSIAVQSTETGDQWETIAEKIGVDIFYGLENIKVLAEKQPNGRFKIRIVDRRPNPKNSPRLYRMAFYLTS